MIEAIFNTVRISSRVAPAWSAARMWRRVPSGFRLVQAAFNATPISSTSFRCRIPPVQGFVVMLRQVSAHFGSHLCNWARASPQGPVSLGRSVFGVVALPALLLIAISYLDIRFAHPAPTDCGL